MTAVTDALVPEPATGGEDVVGDRVLVAVQAVNISRLSTHPVPTVPGTLIVVAGQGPKDSNGAGKSSFIAAITALLGDEQWRFASGARAVSELLFNAELATQGDSAWASADHGYIAGVFDGDGGPLTVWLRVNADAPHLEVRWRPGVHLAAAPSEAERVTLADGVWASLPRGAGRRDVVAKDLGRVLYGGRVRCVSFLSTSVRSKVATNLLSQPLNEIPPERIFNAIAALTGLDRELEAERVARAEEHRERAGAAEAAERLAAWERDAAAQLRAFDRRDRARADAEAALTCWRTRRARLLADAIEADAALAAERAQWEADESDARDAVAAAEREIEQLSGETLDAGLAAAASALADARARAERLGADAAVARDRAEELRRRVPALEDRRREADGRDEAAERAELAAAETRRDEAQQAFGRALGAVAAAERAAAEAEAGASSAPAQLRALAAAGIAADGLLDAIELDEAVRDTWETRLWPYREAVVVAADALDAAAEALAGLPGSMIVAASDGDLPDGVRSTVPIAGFLSGLGGDGVMVVGGFPDPVTGRAARVKAAHAAWEAARAEEEAARRRADDAAADVALATRRLAGARAGTELDAVHADLAAQRDRLAALTAQEAALAPELDAAEREVRRRQARADTRALELDRLRGRREARERDRDRVRAALADLDRRRAALGLAALEEDWGAPRETAADLLAGLDADAATWTPDEWWQTAEKHLSEALRHAFPDGPSDADAPEEIRFLLRERAEGEGRRTEREQATFPRLAAALDGHLRRQADYERHRRRQIEVQLAARHADLVTARKGAEEAAGAAEAHRTALTAAIRARLQRVAEEFDKLDTAFGGYGATLEFPTPEPPADPGQEWRWRVTPKWRRADGQRFVPYNRRANTALMDEKAVKLVCAAALASAGGGRLCLVLDELGRNLGKEHRKEAVALFRKIGETHGITVIGALQDDMEPYAIDACGQYVKLRRSSDAMPYNEPPVVVGYDEHAERVRLLAEQVTAARPE
ncbi:chromosome partitioning protein ParA [Actinomadura rayongensis]|uniref:chromosome partitioning protein ParA n=1 Tax=Actinomadura rayongensis TaxID=1429076 RepID=UPI0035ED4886